jgi:transposase
MVAGAPKVDARMLPDPDRSALCVPGAGPGVARTLLISMFYLAAMAAARFNPLLAGLHRRLRDAGKPPKLAFVAVARKLLTLLNAIARERTARQA